MTFALHDGATRRGLTAHEQGNAENALVADHGDFSRCAILHDIQQRHDGIGRKVDVFELPARLVEHFAQLQWDQLQMGSKALKLACRQCREQVILLRVVWDFHDRASAYAGIGSLCTVTHTGSELAPAETCGKRSPRQFLFHLYSSDQDEQKPSIKLVLYLFHER